MSFKNTSIVHSHQNPVGLNIVGNRTEITVKQKNRLYTLFQASRTYLKKSRSQCKPMEILTKILKTSAKLVLRPILILSSSAALLQFVPAKEKKNCSV